MPASQRQFGLRIDTSSPTLTTGSTTYLITAMADTLTSDDSRTTATNHRPRGVAFAAALADLPVEPREQPQTVRVTTPEEFRRIHEEFLRYKRASW